MEILRKMSVRGVLTDIWNPKALEVGFFSKWEVTKAEAEASGHGIPDYKQAEL